jgi:hypothetical protein
VFGITQLAFSCLELRGWDYTVGDIFILYTHILGHYADLLEQKKGSLMLRENQRKVSHRFSWTD